MYLLVVRHVDGAHDGRHLSTKWSKVAANVSIICDLFDLPALPGIPVTRNGDQNGQSEKHHKDGSYQALPPGTWARNWLICINFGRNRSRNRRPGSRRHWRSGHHLCSLIVTRARRARVLMIRLEQLRFQSDDEDG